MAEAGFGRLERLNLRDYWEREDTHFTPWLAEEENISLLSKTIEIELEVQDQEARVGPFRADILCRNTSDGTLVLIENQLEKTDHTHLGQLMTYGAGLDAVTLIWIVETFTEEHRAALDWLNRITDETFHFFGLEVELWRIGNSNAAPKFNLVAKPNDWSKTAREAADLSRSKLTPWQQLQIEFWASFGDRIEDIGASFKRPSPYPSPWTGFGLGRTGAQLIVGFTKSDATVTVVIDSQKHPSWFGLLEQGSSSVEAELGFAVTWKEQPNLKTSSISLSQNVDMTDQQEWGGVQEWMIQHLTDFDRVFRPRIKELTD